MKTFKELGINEKLVGLLKAKNYDNPTEIQEKTIPLILEGSDLIGQAETGSGKTAACGIPIIQKIDPKLNELQVLILTPTRELALQYLDEVSSVGTPYGVKPFVIFGGFSRQIHLAKLRDGVHILVATPGRLIDIIYNDYFSLEHLKTLVIDEADEMLKMGFIDDVDFITSCIVQKHQTLLFSATMPDAIKRLAKKYMNNPVHILLNTDRVVPQNLLHRYIPAGRRVKEKALVMLLTEEKIKQAIIFCNTRTKVKSLCSSLKRDISGVEYLHGGLDQNVRTRIMDRFRDKKIKYMVTTDVMARGIDVRAVSHIINYDLPKNPDIYIHRTGRTARLGGYGTAVSLVTSDDVELFDEIKAHAGISPEIYRPKVYGKWAPRPAGRKIRRGARHGSSNRRSTGSNNRRGR